jgi:hemerythrin-like domain-containing protein
MSSDAIVVLKDDHKRVKRLFREYERAGEAVTRKQELAQEIIAELVAHTFIENEVMYPRVRTALPDLEDDVLESYEEHHVADVLCGELWALDATDEHFDAKMTVLIENVRHHVDEEESDWFPKVRAGLGRAQLLEIGEELLRVKQNAPRDPTDPRAVASAKKAITA